MSRESPFLGLSSVLNKISQKTLPFNSRPSQTSKEYWSVASFVHLQLLKSQLKSLTIPKFLIKPTIKDKPDSNCPKYTKNQVIFSSKKPIVGTELCLSGLN